MAVIQKQNEPLTTDKELVTNPNAPVKKVAPDPNRAVRPFAFGGLSAAAGAPTTPMEAKTLKESADMINAQQETQIKTDTAVPTMQPVEEATTPTPKPPTSLEREQTLIADTEARTAAIRKEPISLAAQNREIQQINIEAKAQLKNLRAEQKLIDDEQARLGEEFNQELLNEKITGAQNLQDEYAAKGITKSLKASLNEWTKRQEYKTGSPQYAQIADDIAEEMASPEYDMNNAYADIYGKFGGNLSEIDKFTKDYGVPYSTISGQRKEFLTEELGWTDEDFAREQNINRADLQATNQSGFIGGTLKGKNAVDFMYTMEIDNPEKAKRLYQTALDGQAYSDDPIMQDLVKTRLARLGGGDSASLITTMNSLQENPNLFGSLGQATKDKLIASGYQPPIGSALTENQRTNLETTIIKGFDTGTQEARDAERQVKIMNASLKQAEKDFAEGGDINAASQGILVTFQKILDPTSVVRESEYARSGDGQSLLARVEGFATKLKQGGAGVTLEGLQNFVKLGNVFLEGYKESRVNMAIRSKKRAEKYGLDQDVIFDPNTLTLLEEYAQKQGSQTSISDKGIKERSKQCGAFVNDELGLTGQKRMGDTLESKTDAATSKEPLEGGFFVMDTGTEYGHTGIVDGMDENNIYIRDRNFYGDGKERAIAIPKGSKMYNKIIGFGK